MIPDRLDELLDSKGRPGNLSLSQQDGLMHILREFKDMRDPLGACMIQFTALIRVTLNPYRKA